MKRNLSLENGKKNPNLGAGNFKNGSSVQKFVNGAVFGRNEEKMFGLLSCCLKPFHT